MGRAYSAKPAINEDQDSGVPDGWPENWSYPGPPWPPDWGPDDVVPSYSITLYADSALSGEYAGGDSPTMKVVVTTNDDSATYDGELIKLTAEFVDGTAMTLRRNGTSDYLDEVYLEVSSLEASDDIQFYIPTAKSTMSFVVTATSFLSPATTSTLTFTATDGVLFNVSAVGTVKRGDDFEIILQAMSGGAPDRSYTPSAAITLELTSEDGDDALNTATVSTADWTAGRKNVTGLQVTGGSGVDAATITAYEDGVIYGSEAFTVGETSAEILPLILERQKAAGIAEGNRVDLEGSYTLSQLKTYVNAMAVSYVNEYSARYEEGTSTAPTACPADYCDAATTEAQLAVYVLALKRTMHAATGITNGAKYYYGEGPSTGTYEEEKAAAEADFEFIETQTNGASYPPLMITYARVYYSTVVYLEGRSGAYEISGLNTEISHAVTLWSKSFLTITTDDVFYGHSVYMKDNGQYFMNESSLYNTDATWQTGVYFDDNQIFDASWLLDLTGSAVWADSPESSSISYARVGFQLDDVQFLVTWAFTYNAYSG